ncbi:hypothetical protein DFH09DRAFT_1273112 [Mycena vulgaris]|nr:hypothetical protein DFH09DRAFT_1273112 [Mycena vulgaris]
MAYCLSIMSNVLHRQRFNPGELRLREGMAVALSPHLSQRDGWITIRVALDNLKVLDLLVPAPPAKISELHQQRYRRTSIDVIQPLEFAVIPGLELDRRRAGRLKTGQSGADCAFNLNLARTGGSYPTITSRDSKWDRPDISRVPGRVQISESDRCIWQRFSEAGGASRIKWTGTMRTADSHGRTRRWESEVPSVRDCGVWTSLVDTMQSRRWRSSAECKDEAEAKRCAKDSNLKERTLSSPARHPHYTAGTARHAPNPLTRSLDEACGLDARHIVDSPHSGGKNRMLLRSLGFLVRHQVLWGAATSEWLYFQSSIWLRGRLEVTGASICTMPSVASIVLDPQPRLAAPPPHPQLNSLSARCPTPLGDGRGALRPFRDLRFERLIEVLAINSLIKYTLKANHIRGPSLSLSSFHSALPAPGDDNSQIRSAAGSPALQDSDCSQLLIVARTGTSLRFDITATESLSGPGTWDFSCRSTETMSNWWDDGHPKVSDADRSAANPLCLASVAQGRVPGRHVNPEPTNSHQSRRSGYFLGRDPALLHNNHTLASTCPYLVVLHPGIVHMDFLSSTRPDHANNPRGFSFPGDLESRSIADLDRRTRQLRLGSNGIVNIVQEFTFPVELVVHLASYCLVAAPIRANGRSLLRRSDHLLTWHPARLIVTLSTCLLGTVLAFRPLDGCSALEFLW